jgi:hypothetical protein
VTRRRKVAVALEIERFVQTMGRPNVRPSCRVSEQSFRHDMINEKLLKEQWLSAIQAPLSMSFPNRSPLDIAKPLLGHG